MLSNQETNKLPANFKVQTDMEQIFPVTNDSQFTVKENIFPDYLHESQFKLTDNMFPDGNTVNNNSR